MLESGPSLDYLPSDTYLLQVWKLGQELPVVSINIQLSNLIEAEFIDVWSPLDLFSSIQFVESNTPRAVRDLPLAGLSGELTLYRRAEGERRVHQHFSFLMEDATNCDTLQIVANPSSDSLLLTSQAVECAPVRHTAIRASAYPATLIVNRTKATSQVNDDTNRTIGSFMAVDLSGRRLLHWDFSNPSLHSSPHWIPLTRGFWLDQWMPHLMVGDGSRRAVLDLAKGLRTIWTVESTMNEDETPAPKKTELQPGNLDVVDIKNGRFVASLRYLGDMNQHWSLHAVASCPDGKFLLTQLVVVPVPTGTTQSSPIDQAKFYKDMSDGKTVAYTLWQLP